nr:putative reverse transcriptase domain-containing protein [Tanacetum cinerariifolium]
MIDEAIQKKRKNLRDDVISQVNDAIANHIPPMVDAFLRDYITNDDEVPNEKVSQELVEEMSDEIDEAKLQKAVNEMLRQRFPFLDDDMEEQTSMWVDKLLKKFNVYARYSVEYWKNMWAKHYRMFEASGSDEMFRDVCEWKTTRIKKGLPKHDEESGSTAQITKGLDTSNPAEEVANQPKTAAIEKVKQNFRGTTSSHSQTSLAESGEDKGYPDPIESQCHTFIIDLIPLVHGSFDVIIGMDWLSKLRAKIVYNEKIIQIMLPNGDILEVHEERPEGNMKQLMTMKVNEPKLQDIPVVCEILGVLLEYFFRFTP